MSRSPRAEALHLIRSGRPVVQPEVPDIKANSAEALAFLDAHKPQYYVALAQVVDVLLDRFMVPANKDRLSSMSGSSKRGDIGWINLSSGLREQLLRVAKGTRDTSEYREADLFTRTISRFNPHRRISLEHQLSAGIGTAVVTTMPFIKNLPHIVGSHVESGEQLEIAAVAKHPRSSMLLGRLAKSSINHALAAQSALEGVATAHSWQDGMTDIVLQPQHFRLNRYPDNNVGIGYADFSGLEVPAGYRLRDSLPAIRETTLAKDMTDPATPVVGCPITLLPGRLAELWQWEIDLVEANELWDEDLAVTAGL